MLISAGTGAVATRIILKRELRQNVSDLLTAIESQIAAGGAQQVLSEIRATDHTGDPDANDFDLLKHLPTMKDNLTAKQSSVASNAGSQRH